MQAQETFAMSAQLEQAGGSVVQAFEAHARRAGGAIAIQFDQERVTYGALNQKANGLAEFLVELGLQPGSPVAICLDPSPLTAVAILGVLKAGGAYVPISSGDPVDRVAYVLGDTGASVLLTEERLLPGVRELAPHPIPLDRVFDSLDDLARDNPQRACSPQETAYILYTSGSSGKPKGVMVPHESLAYYLNWHCEHLRPALGDVDLPLSSSMSFAAGVTQFYTPLLLGRTQHVFRQDTLRQPERVFAWYRAHPEFGLYCVPTLWNELVKFAERQREGGDPVVGPRAVLLSGEAATTQLVERSVALWPGLRLWNLYGPTEATANASAGELLPGAPVTLGAPLVGSSLHLVDEAMREIPCTETQQEGEICISGDGVATGYLNLPELTRERFLPNPFRMNRGKRLFRTGDLAKYTGGGELEFIGRRDFQVKIRGYRIECGEIEAALLQHPAVRQSVVVSRDYGEADKRLVAYVTFHFARYASVDELRAFLAERLPDYMIPAVFVMLEAFPQLANGKIDRRRLPAPGRTRPDLGYAFVAPRTVRERQLVRIWEETLGLEGLGVNDNFFDLGGDSLKVAAALARLGETLRGTASYRDFFNHSTPAALALILGSGEEERQPEQKRMVLPPLELQPRRATYPCAPNQHSLWLLTQTFRDLTAYNMQFSLRLEGELEEAALAASLRAILRRHDALRSVVGVDRGRPMMKVLDAAEPAIAAVDWSGLAGEAQEREWEQLAAEECRRPFALEAGPLVRFTRCRLGPTRNRLLVTVHHMVCDGQSIGVFCRDFVQHYRACRAGQPLPAAARAVQYQDWVAWQAGWFCGATEAGALEFWKQQLDGSPQVLSFPTDYIRPAVRRFHGATKIVRIGADLKRQLAAFNRREGVTSFMTLLAVFNVLLYRYSGQDDLLVGCPVANRQPSGVEELIGFFANTIVLRTRVAKDDSFRSLVAKVRDAALQSFEHQSVSFDRLVDTLRSVRSLSLTPVFQVMFAFHEKLFAGRVHDSLSAEAYEDGNPASKYDLSLDAQDREGDIDLRLTYDADLYEPDTAARFLSEFVLLLRSALENPQKSVSDYRLITDADLARIGESNSTANAIARGQGLHRLFEEQAARTPDRTALIAAEERLSYHALDARANQLARELVRLGVMPGQVVGVHLEPSVGMIVALFAILKTGAAYLPLDPYYPKDRIDHIIRDSRVRVIVTEHLLANRLPADCVALSLDADWPRIAGQSPEALDRGAVEPGALMYLMYTSGSTGAPKGVMVPHEGAANYVLWMQRTFPLSADDKILSKTSINFDISVWEIFLPLVSGAQLVIGRRDDLQSPERLAALIRREAITHVQFVPSALRAFVDSGQLAGCQSLRRIISGGEALPVTLQQEVFNAFSGELHNLYGPTETSIYVTHWACQRQDRRRSVPIGRPIDNAQIHILDARLEPVSIGMTGDVYISGACVAAGYFEKPELTAAAFVPPPWATDSRARMFKTGDLGRYWNDGAIEFLGRSDRQVKVRGYRIELAEIEHHLTSHPQVKHAIIIVREDKVDDVRLVAYLLYREKKGPETKELREYLRRKLPDYMIPSTFVSLDSIPLLPNNKANVNALPKPEYQKTLQTELERHYSNECERALAEIWEEVLATSQFGPEDSFFDVGWHSLLMAELRRLIEVRLQKDVSNIDLYQFPTIRSLARHLTRNDRPASAVVSDMARRAALGRTRGKSRAAAQEN
jgi:amino acid adenylation domain-containing protein